MERYRESAARIAAQTEEAMRQYLKGVNLQVIKVLEIRDVFGDRLQQNCLAEFSGYETAQQPVESDEALAALMRETGKAMFFEFQQDKGERQGILVDPCTGKINEYGKKRI